MHPMPKLTVEQCKTHDLLPYANNAKIHTREQIDQIEASIKEFGFNDPVAVWENTAGELEIIEGHGRVIAAKNLKIDTLPVIRLDHLTDEQRRAYTHVHNQLTLNTGWDFETLEQELDALDFDFSDFGFEGAASFNAIENLLSEDFITLQDAFAENFNVTFTFPVHTKESVLNYIKETGKEEIVSNIINAAEKWGRE